MVPYPAGGPSDAIARIFNQQLGKELGQQVLVENLGGVSGALAAQKVLGAPADGQYIFQGSPNEVILSPLANAAVKLKTEDFRLVHPVADAVMVFVVRKDLPVNSVDELIALARERSQGGLVRGIPLRLRSEARAPSHPPPYSKSRRSRSITSFSSGRRGESLTAGQYGTKPTYG